MNVLVLNAGSSSLKFQIIATDAAAMASDGDRRLARGAIERIGGHALVTVRPEGGERRIREIPLRDLKAAIQHLLDQVCAADSGVGEIRSLDDIHAAGHRVVHGGQRFTGSVRIDDEVLRGIEDVVELAPLHNPSNLRAIRAVQDLLGPGVPQVAVFDTAFHATMPESSFLYGIPYSYYRRFGVRRYGFHGTSHRYVAFRYRMLRGLRREDVHIITLHLGNGASACAIRGGESFDTSMGFTPLEGLMMGTRCGDIDASVLPYLADKEGLGVHEVERLFNKQSGLLGVSGLTSDMRELLAEEREHQDRRVTLAIDMFCQRVRRYIGAFFAEMGGADAVVFTGGIGENSPEVRRRICAGLGRLGIELDPAANDRLVDGRAGPITVDGAALPVWVIPTDEELLIARDTVRVIEGSRAG